MQLGLTGTRVSCVAGQCGACYVLTSGKPACSCITKLSNAVGVRFKELPVRPEKILARLKQ